MPGSSGKLALDDVLSASDDTLSAVSEFIAATEQEYYEQKYAEENMNVEGGGFPPEFVDGGEDTLSWDASSQGVDEEMWKKMHEQHHQDL